MRRICIINQKGGVGKTTTTINLGAGLSRKGRKVLLIDLDPQGNISTCFHDSSQKDMYDFLIDNADIRECIKNLGTNFDMITCKGSLTNAEAQILRLDNKETLLRRKLKEFREVLNYDYILIDCPPAIGMLTQNAILASTEAIIPSACDFLGLNGLRSIVEFINFVSEKYDHDLTISKIVPTMLDQRHHSSQEVLNQMTNDFYEIVSDPIRFSIKLKESPQEGMSIFRYAANSPAAEDYSRLINQVIFDERKFKISQEEDELFEVENTENVVGDMQKTASVAAKAASTVKKKTRRKKSTPKYKRVIPTSRMPIIPRQRVKKNSFDDDFEMRKPRKPRKSVKSAKPKIKSKKIVKKLTKKSKTKSKIKPTAKSKITTKSKSKSTKLKKGIKKPVKKKTTTVKSKLKTKAKSLKIKKKTAVKVKKKIKLKTKVKTSTKAKSKTTKASKTSKKPKSKIRNHLGKKAAIALE
ncbi:ParA family protein [Candidatus Woesearchaeota archaeon]|jgi:chromosome partitioning protein|nr:ParA family protein [Candidatus Woesearchaeota archaeon]MBT5272279.1 ParA family protein [Candidatus Woesearchaeota archaeon]MBT6041128.1 ParA family protein [Candidatus Woesearchaeota archaeon]MBT6336551.1 ParA family protein [Candidatus Woesearchaeota archaeon]MBT7927441.1 ParA family protein [Candidatus Woesearchaeota archaeon]